MAQAGDLEEVAKLLQAAVRAGCAPGFVALWGNRRDVWTVAYGQRGLGSGPVDVEVWYDLASLTKPLVTTTLVLLARREKLGLEDPLARFLPELSGSCWGRVTVAQCLTHTAGFPAWEPMYAFGSCSREGYLQALRGIPPQYSPGEGVTYSCLGFIALGLVLERVGEADLASLFHREVLMPLGLAPFLGFRPALSTRVAQGELKFFVEEGLCRQKTLSCAPPPALVEAWSCDDGNARGLNGIAGNAGLFGTAWGVFALAREYLPGGGKLLQPEEVALAVRNWTPGLGQHRGLGWQLASTPGCSAGPALTSTAFGHTGFTGTSVWVEPEKEAAFVLLSNRLHPWGRTPDLHPLRRRFHALASESLRRAPTNRSIRKS